MEAEAESLFLFARNRGLDLSEMLPIVTSMAFFQGHHPTPEETHDFITSKLGYLPFSDSSTTLDYISKDGLLVLRDCHPKNWIKAKNTLIPIDIIPESKEPTAVQAAPTRRIKS